MACSRLAACRYVRPHPTAQSRCCAQQRRWARVHDVRFVATQHIQRNVTDRYKHLLEKKAQSEGLNSVDELKEAYKNEIQSMRKNTNKSQSFQQTSHASKQSDGLNQQERSLAHVGALNSQSVTNTNDRSLQDNGTSKVPGIKTLSSFLDLQKTLELPSEEIQSIWRLRHAANKQSLCAAIPASTFSAIYETARRHPRFILPGLPPASENDASSVESQDTRGAPIHFLQWTFPSPDTVTVLFTHLAEYKLRGEYSQPHTTLTHHLELAESKGLVLCQGSVIPDRGVSVEEGKWLVLCMQRFYNTKAIDDIEADMDTEIGKDLKKKRRKLIEQFNQGDTNFKIEELLDQADRLG